jgi:hypothetical protein
VTTKKTPSPAGFSSGSDRPSDEVQWAWYGAKVNVDWTPVAVISPDLLLVGYNYNATYTSPIFDLRPDLRSSQAGPKQGVPVWSRSGRLYIQFSAPNNQVLVYPSGLSAKADEFIQTVVVQNVNLPGVNLLPSMEFMGQTDVSTLFATTVPNQKTILAGFYPPGTTLGFGEGYPVRYWRIQLQFTYFYETGFPLPIPAPVLPPLPVGVSLPTELQAAVY